MTEGEWLDQVTEIAERMGWSWLHLRPARTAHGWRTPVSGPLGAGWPDLILVRDDRIIAAELKSADGRPSPAQLLVLTLLQGVAETYVWRPDDFDDVARVLGRTKG